MESTTYAYLAGFLDGEGSIVISHTSGGVGSGSSHVLEVKAYNTDPRPITRLSEVLGGEVLLRKSKGKMKDGRENQPCYVWRIRSSKAKHALEQLLPFLCVKREMAEIAIAFEGLRQHHHSLYSRQRHPNEAWEAREAPRENLLMLNKKNIGVKRPQRPQPQGTVDRSLRAQRLSGVVSLCERKEAS